MKAREEELREAERELADKQEGLRKLYARFKEMGHKLWLKDAVGVSNGRFYRQPYGRHQIAAKALIKLQENINQQAMLLLELRHAIDMEQKRILSLATKTDL